MANAGQVVQGFMSVIGKGDFASARKFLHDNLSFRGPIDSFEKPEPYLQAMEKLNKMVERVDMRKMFIDGNDVCLLYDLVTKTPVGTAFVCEWYKVKGEKIGEIRTLFDARPFAAMFAGKAAT